MSLLNHFITKLLEDELLPRIADMIYNLSALQSFGISTHLKNRIYKTVSEKYYRTTQLHPATDGVSVISFSLF